MELSKYGSSETVPKMRKTIPELKLFERTAPKMKYISIGKARASIYGKVMQRALPKIP